MKTKKCNQCFKIKPIEQFSFRKDSNSYRKECNKCRSYNEILRSRTKEGLVRKIYNNQKRACRKRKHESPKYTIYQLRNWIFSRNNFDNLYENWVKSEFDKRYAPSVDRINDNKTYSFDNIQLITCMENDLKSKLMQRAGTLKTTHKSVIQYTINGEYVNTYESMMEAKRCTGIDNTCISDACKGKYSQAGGYKWEYGDS